ncbi:MAG: PLP-dependent aminotransferase family protein [Oceanospirillaceae bacterium]
MKQPKYQVIAAQISQLIEAGEYPKESKLPPHRVLAKQLHTTAVTVAKAYQLLVEQRKIASFVGRGSFVLAERLNNVIQAGIAPSELNFSILQPCISLNIPVLESLLRANLYNQTSTDLFSYSENTGLQRHREAGAKWCQEYGLTVASSEDIMLTNGAQNALASIIALYSKEGDCIAVEAQSYPGVLSICKYLRRRVVAIEMDGQGMLPQALAAQCEIEKPSIVIVVPAQQNPTAATMLSLRRQQLASVIEAHQLWLIEDDIYAFLNQQVLTPITDLIPNLAFYISSLSKAISPGMRCGYVKVPHAERLKVIDYIRATIWLASPFMFELASDAINSGAAFNWAQLQKDKAQQRQELVSQYLHQPVQRQMASYSCWLQLPQYWSATGFTAAAQEKGVVVSDASYFNAGVNDLKKSANHANTANAVRLSVMAVTQDADFVKGLKIIEALVMTNPKQ